MSEPSNATPNAVPWRSSKAWRSGLDGRTWLAELTAARFFDQAIAYHGMGLQATRPARLPEHLAAHVFGQG